MIKVLETAIEKVKQLPEERQAYAAHVLEELARDATSFVVPVEHRTHVLEGLEQARRGELIDDESAHQVLRRPWA